jgi:hypothetical protein
LTWCPQQESNLHLILRRDLLYPFNYGDIAIYSNKTQSVSEEKQGLLDHLKAKTSRAFPPTPKELESEIRVLAKQPRKLREERGFPIQARSPQGGDADVDCI